MSKADRILEAIMTKDKANIKKVLQSSKPDKWLNIAVDYESKTIEYKGEFISVEQLKEIKEEEEKTFNVNFLVISFSSINDNEEDFLDSIDFGTVQTVTLG